MASIRRVLHTENEEPGNKVWDDGHHSQISFISISYQNNHGVNGVRFAYRNVNQAGFEGDYHGPIRNITHNLTEDFALGHNEVLKKVITWNKKGVRRIEFRTNHKSFACGMPKEVLDDAKTVFYECSSRRETIAGFHGNNGNRLLHQLGVYFVSPAEEKEPEEEESEEE